MKSETKVSARGKDIREAVSDIFQKCSQREIHI